MVDQMQTQSSLESSDNEELNEGEITKQTFSKQIEHIVVGSEGSISFLDATISLADIYGIDIDKITKYITPNTIERIKNVAIENNMIRRKDQKSIFKNDLKKQPSSTPLTATSDFWL